METPDALLARTADYCVIATATGDGLAVRWLVFGNAGWQQLRVDGNVRLPVGRRAILYLSQGDDNIGLRGLREIEGEDVRAVSTRDWPQDFRKFLRPEVANAEVLPTRLPDYILAVQEIAAKARAKRVGRARTALGAMGRGESKERQQEYERINALADAVVSELHADDHETLGKMAEIIRVQRDSFYNRVRGLFAGAIADKNFAPGFDAIRAEAFRDTRAYDASFSEGDALHGLSRIGNKRDLVKMRAQIDSVVAAGVYSHLLHSRFHAIGRLVARLYPEGSVKRDEWRNWLERLCTNPTAQEKESGCHFHALRPLEAIGTKHTQTLLQSLKVHDTDHSYAYDNTIQQIDLRIRGQ
jgi:hypothetical protein